MDARRVFLKLLAVFCALALLTGCETRSSTDALEIIGEPPTNVFYDSYFEFEFGIAGGEGPYSYRYVQNPDDSDENLSDNYHVFEVRDGDTAGKPSFILSGVPRLRDGESFDDASASETFAFALEVKDNTTGVVVSREFEFTVNKNALRIISEEPKSREGRVDASASDTLRNAFELIGDEAIGCLSEKDKAYVESTLGDGTRVQPQTYLVTLDAPVASDVEIEYRFVSSYDQSSPEFSERNLGRARPNVDYIEQTRVLKFEAGKRTCLISLDLLDDARIEGDEELRVEFLRRTGGMVEFGSAGKSIVIVDNEPGVKILKENLTVNVGGEVSIPVELSSFHGQPLNIAFRVDEAASNLSGIDYQFTPESGVLTLDAGEQEGAISIAFDATSDGDVSLNDFLFVTTDLDPLLEREPLKIGINRWAADALDNEIVASASNDEEAVSFTHHQGNVYVLIEDQIANERAAIVRAFDKAANALGLTEDGDLIIDQLGNAVVPKGIEVIGDQESGQDIVVVVEINGRLSYGGQTASEQRGKTDFAVLRFRKLPTDTYYQLVSLRQYGTEGDDHVVGVDMDSSNNLFVYGSTDGQVFEGDPSESAANGLVDGFVYKISPAGSVLWARFLGTADEDVAARMAVSRSRVVVGIETTNTDRDIVVIQLSAQNGQEFDDVERLRLSSLNDDSIGAMAFSEDDSFATLIVDSVADIPLTSPTPSLSQDVHILNYGLDGTSVGKQLFASSGLDSGTDFEVLLKENTSALGGYTQGVLEGNTAKGDAGDTDAFIALSEALESGGSQRITESLQFGTPGDDRAIQIETADDRKFYVLWSENYSDPAGAMRYRISAFSSEGEKLSADPF